VKASPRHCCLIQQKSSLFTERIASMLEKINEVILGGSRQPTLIGFRNSCESTSVMCFIRANWH
jgi:hypothetical protein